MPGQEVSSKNGLHSSIGRCLPSMHKAFGSVSNTIIKQAWWLSPVIPGFGKWDLEGQKFKVSF